MKIKIKTIKTRSVEGVNTSSLINDGDINNKSNIILSCECLDTG